MTDQSVIYKVYQNYRPLHAAHRQNPRAMAAQSSPPAQSIDHYENFPVASWLCPANLRPPIAAIYHFARTADDLADEGPAPPAQRLQALADYREQLRQACAEPSAPAGPAHSWDPRWQAVFAPLQLAIAQHRLPASLLHALLDAFVQDVEKTRDGTGYASMAELLDYCRHSAHPVGRLLLHLYGVTEAQALAQSDAICSALQLINFWQDPSVDLPRGRNYFPHDWMTQYGVSPADLLAPVQSSAVTQLLQGLANHARQRMLQGAPLVHRVPGRAGWELRLVVQGGLRLLDRIDAIGYTTLCQRPTLRRWDYGVMLWRACWMAEAAP